MRKNAILTCCFLSLTVSAIPSLANANIVEGTGNNPALPILTLDSSGLPGAASLSGGTVYDSTHPSFAAEPVGTQGNFLAVGPSNGIDPAVLTFTNPLNYLSFLWGSPDTYNGLTVTTNDGTYNYTAASAGVTPPDGNQSFSEYVHFTLGGGEYITSISLTSNGTNAFEVSNFSVTAVPELTTWAMMMVGFLGLGFLGYRKSAGHSQSLFRLA